MKDKNTKKLTDWDNEPKANQLNEYYLYAQTSQTEHLEKVERWNSLINEGFKVTKPQEGRSKITPKIIKQVIQTTYPNLASPFLTRGSIIDVQATNIQYAKGALIHTRLLNFYWNNVIDKTSIINEAMLRLVSDGTTLFRVGWNYQLKDIINEPEVIEVREPEPIEERQIIQYLQNVQERLQHLNPNEITDDMIESIIRETPDYDPRKEKIYEEAFSMDTQRIREDLLNEALTGLDPNSPEYQEQAHWSERNVDLQVQELETAKAEAQEDYFKYLESKLSRDDLITSVTTSYHYGRPVVAINTGKTKKQRETVVAFNEPTLELVNLDSLYVDPSCKGNLDKAKYVFYTFESTLAELRKNEEELGYKNLKKLEKSVKKFLTAISQQEKEEQKKFNAVLGVSPIESFNNEEIGSTDEKIDEMVIAQTPLLLKEYWGEWDINDDGILVPIKALYCGDVMIKLEVNPFPDGKHPFVAVAYNPIRDSFYGESIAEGLEDSQKLITIYTRASIDVLARSANGQRGIPKRWLDSDNLNKFRKGQDYQYNPELGFHPTQAIYMHTFPELPQSMFMLYQQERSNVEQISGVKMFYNGIDQQSYGRDIGNGSMEAIITHRETNIVQRFSTALSKVFSKILRLAQIYIEDGTQIKLKREDLKNLNQQYNYLTVDGMDLVGNYRVSVETVSASENLASSQQLAFLLQTLGQSTDQRITQSILADITKSYNKFDLADEILSIEPPPPPEPDPMLMEQAKAELEKAKAEALYKMSEAEVNKAKSAETMARAGYIEELTKKVSAEFLDLVDGTKHKNQKELMESQANAQANFKLAEQGDEEAKQNIKKAMKNDKEEENILKEAPTTPTGNINEPYSAEFDTGNPTGNTRINVPQGMSDTPVNFGEF